VLFLLRPRQTSMPFALRRDPASAAARNEQRQKAYAATRRLPLASPTDSRDVVAELKELARLRDGGALTGEEFARGKALILDS
jgi:hypothetical protein